MDVVSLLRTADRVHKSVVADREGTEARAVSLGTTERNVNQDEEIE